MADVRISRARYEYMLKCERHWHNWSFWKDLLPMLLIMGLVIMLFHLGKLKTCNPQWPAGAGAAVKSDQWKQVARWEGMPIQPAEGSPYFGVLLDTKKGTETFTVDLHRKHLVRVVVYESPEASPCYPCGQGVR